jgi:hypothetical protein|tara:strand:+ start:2738 stop:2926 length:189 start_codon:yes stop_codon:yes gene_type:complete
MNATLAVHVAEGEDGSHAVLISLDGFDTAEEASEFAYTFLMDGRLAVGGIEFVPSEELESVH